MNCVVNKKISLICSKFTNFFRAPLIPAVFKSADIKNPRQQNCPGFLPIKKQTDLFARTGSVPVDTVTHVGQEIFQVPIFFALKVERFGTYLFVASVKTAVQGT